MTTGIRNESDKREVAEVFRERLARLIERRQESFSAFADAIGIDRSALSQFIAPGSTRLPRAETLHAIARCTGVTVDWLLGLIATEEKGGESVPALEMVETNEHLDENLIGEWHRQASGYKIRYLPSGLPDLLRTETVSHHQFAGRTEDVLAAKDVEAREQLAYSRRPETDMEVCLPIQRLNSFAAGQGVWSGLSASARREQLETIALLCREMYPTFRLFLFDERRVHAPSYTVFGPKRAAIYLGGLYLVVNSVEHIKRLTLHFDNLIRIAEVGPDRVADFASRLADGMSGE